MTLLFCFILHPPGIPIAHSSCASDGAISLAPSRKQVDCQFLTVVLVLNLNVNFEQDMAYFLFAFFCHYCRI